jgi:hypothetical protein
VISYHTTGMLSLLPAPNPPEFYRLLHETDECRRAGAGESVHARIAYQVSSESRVSDNEELESRCAVCTGSPKSWSGGGRRRSSSLRPGAGRGRAWPGEGTRRTASLGFPLEQHRPGPGVASSCQTCAARPRLRFARMHVCAEFGLVFVCFWLKLQGRGSAAAGNPPLWRSHPIIWPLSWLILLRRRSSRSVRKVEPDERLQLVDEMACHSVTHTSH